MACRHPESAGRAVLSYWVWKGKSCSNLTPNIINNLPQPCFSANTVFQRWSTMHGMNGGCQSASKSSVLRGSGLGQVFILFHDFVFSCLWCIITERVKYETTLVTLAGLTNETMQVQTYKINCCQIGKLLSNIMKITKTREEQWIALISDNMKRWYISHPYICVCTIGVLPFIKWLHSRVQHCQVEVRAARQVDYCKHKINLGPKL